jgi:hypothetical protein
MTKLLVLDASGADPRWLLVDIDDADVLPAVLAGRGARMRFTDWPGVLAWVADQVGYGIRLSPLAASAWRVDAPSTTELRSRPACALPQCASTGPNLPATPAREPVRSGLQRDAHLQDLSTQDK